MRHLINNLANKDNTTVNDEQVFFPVENQYSNILVEKTQLNLFMDIDLGASVNIKAVSIFKTQITSSPILTIFGSDTFAGADFSLVLTEDVHFIDETFRFWRVTTNTPTFINNAYFGVFFEWPGVKNSPIPEELNTDVIGITNSSQIYTTQGDQYKQITVDIAISTRKEYEEFLAWYKSDDRKNNHVLVMFEDNIDTLYDPFFAKLMGNIVPSKDIVNYDYSLTFREAK